VLFDAVKNLEELRSIVSHRKQKTGILDFDFPETKIILDEKRFPVDIQKYERYNSMKIIEECMVLANESVGELFSKLPFLYRIHPIPGDEDIEKLRATLAIFGIVLPYKKITPKVISGVLEEIKNSPKEKLLSKLILRSLEKAVYSEKNEGHFGLGLDFYSHFTSPIRRYPDLQIHRIIKDQIHGKMLPAQRNFYDHNLPKVAKHTSETERKSEKLEYTIRDLMVCKYYQDKIAQQFSGTISGMISA
jgi:ribonuclease R